jgi:anti-anti-sigma factor
MEDRLPTPAHSDNGATTVRPRGEIDLASRDELRAALQRCNGDVVVDLSEVVFLDATCVAVLVAERTRLTERGGSLRLREPNASVSRILAATGLASWIDHDAVATSRSV